KELTPTTCTSVSTACFALSTGGWNNGPISTSNPKAAKEDATTLEPRSWPSCPIFATIILGRRPSFSKNSSAISITLSISSWFEKFELYTPLTVESPPYVYLKLLQSHQKFHQSLHELSPLSPHKQVNFPHLFWPLQLTDLTLLQQRNHPVILSSSRYVPFVFDELLYCQYLGCLLDPLLLMD